MKYRPDYPKDGFETIESAREWVFSFVYWYNNEHYHSGINYLTPISLHDGLATNIMKKRTSIYNSAKFILWDIFLDKFRGRRVPTYQIIY